MADAATNETIRVAGLDAAAEIRVVKESQRSGAARPLTPTLSRKGKGGALAGLSSSCAMATMPHRAEVISTAPKPVRPKRSGRYMSSITAAGET